MEIKNRSRIIIVIVALVVIFFGGMILFRPTQKTSISQDLLNPNESSHRIRGIVTQVEPGKDGVQVELETENELYNVTISIIQAEIEGDVKQIKIGAEIEATGQLLDGMEPPLLVAEKVIVLRNQK